MIEFEDNPPPAATSTVERDAWTTRGNKNRGSRILAEETPVALVHNAATTAVMMATPADLEDFAIGFSLSEGIIDHVSDIVRLDIVTSANGVEARMWLKPGAANKQLARRRRIVGPTGCGLCGVESLAEAAPALRSLAHCTAAIATGEIVQAFEALQNEQVLGGATRAVHAAALWRHHGLCVVREDVGRHNAVDKLIGACARDNRDNIEREDGVLLLTSRVSIDLVQKAAILGAPIICAVSAPTALAVRAAEEAGITLAAIVRQDGFEVFSRPDRVQF